MKTHEIVVKTREEFERISKALEGSFGVPVANGEAPTTIEINGDNAIERVMTALDGIVKYSPDQERDDHGRFSDGGAAESSSKIATFLTSAAAKHTGDDWLARYGDDAAAEFGGMAANWVERIKAAETAHGEYETTALGGKRDEAWAQWYADHIVGNAIKKLFDEELHPRDESGKFTFGGTAGFVAPNVASQKDFGQASTDLTSNRQNFIRNVFADVDNQMGIKPNWTHDVVGAWADGAENSAMVNFGNVSYDSAKAMMAMKGYLANQKQVLVFQSRETGATDFLANFNANGKLADIHAKLLADGVEYHTLAPTKTGATVYVYGSGQGDVDKIRKASEHYGSTPKIEFGKGEFIGTHQTSGTDAEQREDARRVYESVIAASGLRGVAKQWPVLRDRWRSVADAVKRVVDDYLAKYSPEQSRDDHGRWVSEGTYANSSLDYLPPQQIQDRLLDLGYRDTPEPKGVTLALYNPTDKIDQNLSLQSSLGEILGPRGFDPVLTEHVPSFISGVFEYEAIQPNSAADKGIGGYSVWHRGEQYVVGHDAKRGSVLWFIDRKPKFLGKYDADQPRDEHGQWTDGGAGFSGDNHPNVQGSIWWHGSPSGDLRGGTSGLHLGTHEAAKQALEARIGAPADGKGWSGDRKYGDTLLAGSDTLAKIGVDLTGFNAGGPGVKFPKEDFYARDYIAKYPEQAPDYSDGSFVSLDSKPSIQAFSLTGKMTNTKHAPHEDFKANGLMRGQLKRGNAKSGYYYKNVGEDGGSVSIVVPNEKHVKVIDRSLLKFDENEPRDDQGQWTEGGASDDEKEALKVYGGPKYHDINHALRHQMTLPKDLAAHVKNLDAMFARTATPKEQNVWRVFTPEQYKSLGLDKLTQGNTFTDKGYTSTTTSPSRILNNLEGGIAVQIIIPKGYPAVKLGAHATVAQREITLDRDSTFKIKEPKKYFMSGGKKMPSDDPIVLEVVPKGKQVPKPGHVVDDSEADHLFGAHVKKYDPSEPRDEQGQWTDGGGSSDSDAPGKASRGEQASLSHYTNDGFKRINAAMRGEGKASARDTQAIKDIIGLLGREKLTEDRTLFRSVTGVTGRAMGAQNLKELIGKDLPAKSFQSTAKDFKTAMAFTAVDQGKQSQKGNGLVMEIHAAKGTPAIDVDAYKSRDTAEDEMLLGPGSYHVDGVEQATKFGVKVSVLRVTYTPASVKKLSLISKEFDEELHPRDKDGKFTDGDGGGSYEVQVSYDTANKLPFSVMWPGGKHVRAFATRDEADKFAAQANKELPGVREQARLRAEEDAKLGSISYHPDFEVTNVGGDQWNRDTALRLERQYVEAKPALTIIEKNATAQTVVSDNLAEEDKNPTTWDALNSDQQSDAETEWRNAKYDSYYESEKDYYYNEQAKNDAASDVAYKFNDQTEREWASDALDKMQEERDKEGKAEIPYTNDQLLDAITLHGETAEVEDFDNDKLKTPMGFIGPEQGQETLPGITPEDPSARLTQEMRNDIEQALNGAVEKQIDTVASDLPVPEYVAESVNESLGSAWDEMSDEQKFEAAQEYLSGIKEGVEANITTTKLDKLPTNYDPLNMPFKSPSFGNESAHRADYDRTQALAKIMSQQRALQLLEQRGLHPENWNMIDHAAAVQAADDSLWRGWVSSSTSSEGKILQLASSEELGGRLYEGTLFKDDGNTRESLMSWLKEQPEFSEIGGYEGVKALVRAKWETSQYLLDKAGISTVDVYRGIRPDEHFIANMTADERKMITASNGSIYTALPSYSLARNGALSTSLKHTVADSWNGDDRIVFRISAPRTAVLSLPAYGKNHHEEREVVLAGTAWKDWDAWYRAAPTFQDFPMAVGPKQ